MLAAAHGFRGLVLDTSRVTFADSGLLALLDGWTGPHRRVRMTNTSVPVRRLLDVAAAAGRHRPRAGRPGRPAGPPPPARGAGPVHASLATDGGTMPTGRS